MLHKILLPVALALLASASLAAEMPDDCIDPLREYATREALKVACDAADITKKILEGSKATVPSSLYHFGKRELLEANAAANTIPKDAWDNSIIGDKERRFTIEPIRRGLYGTHEVDTNSFYEPNGKYNWMMEIRIKPECRNPAHVASLERLQDDPRFQAWASKAPGLLMSVATFKEKCFKTFNYKTVYEDADCKVMANQFLKDSDIKVVQDHIIQKSFYIRDRDCIAGISARPADLLKVFADNPALWIKSCGAAYDFYGPFYRLTPLLFKLLVNEDLRDVQEETFEHLLDNTKLLNAGDDSGRELLDSLVRSYAAARKEGKAEEWQLAMRKVPTVSVAEAPPILPKVLVEKVKGRMLQ